LLLLCWPVAQEKFIVHFFRIENELLSVEPLDEFVTPSGLYKNVMKLELDTVPENSLHLTNPQIWQVYIADSTGFIQFSDRINKHTWTLIKEN
jgi:hypothetical protein